MKTLNLPDMAAMLQIDEPTTLRLLETGMIPSPTSIGGELARWRADDVSTWWQSGCPASPPPTRRQMLDIRSAFFNDHLREIDRLVDKIGERRAAEIFDSVDKEYS